MSESGNITCYIFLPNVLTTVLHNLTWLTAYHYTVHAKRDLTNLTLTDAQVIIFTGSGGAWPPALLSKIGNICSSWVRQSRHISEIFKFILSSSPMLNFLLITKHQQTSHVLPFYTESELTTLKPKIPSWKTKLRNKDMKFDDGRNKTLTKLTCIGVNVMTSLRAWQPKNHGSTVGRSRTFSSPVMRRDVISLSQITRAHSAS